MPPEAPKPVPRATYRLQFTKDFGFAQAANLASYLAELGISHVYASPYLRADFPFEIAQELGCRAVPRIVYYLIDHASRGHPVA
jgi:phosphohistidine phosphatase SixA